MQRAGVAPSARTAVRLRPVPPVDPPFDDESGQGWGTAADQLTLELTGGPRSGPGARPPGSMPPSRRRPQAPTRPRLPGETPVGAAPETRRAAARFLGTCLEIFNGYRPVWHARPLACPAVSQAVLEQLTTGTARVNEPHPARRGQRTQVTVRRLRVCEPCPAVAEVAVVLDGGGRTWAMAFRLERGRAVWRVAALRVL